MDILMSLHNQWSDKILDGTKSVEFRNRLPKNLKEDTTIFIYESGHKGGSKMVVGECKVANIISVLSPENKWPLFGAAPFIVYYFREIKKDEITAEIFENVIKKFETPEYPYRYGYSLNYVFAEAQLKSLEQTGRLLDVMSLDTAVINEIHNQTEKAHQYIEECDNWLTSIGFYNDFEESTFRFGIVLKDVKKYDEPLPLSSFVDQKGNDIGRAPQSWMYAHRKGG